MEGTETVYIRILQGSKCQFRCNRKVLKFNSLKYEFYFVQDFLDEEWGMGSVMGTSLLCGLSAMTCCVSRAGRSIPVSDKCVQLGLSAWEFKSSSFALF